MNNMNGMSEEMKFQSVYAVLEGCEKNALLSSVDRYIGIIENDYSLKNAYAQYSFVAELLQGYFDSNSKIDTCSHSIYISSISETLIQDISILLLYFGIFSSIYSETKTTYSTSKNHTPLYCLSISHKYVKQFFDKIGTNIKLKETDIKLIIEYSELDHLHSSEIIDKIPELGHIISRLGNKLQMSDYKTYSIWEQRNMSIGRQTLKKYIDRFELRACELNIVEDLDIKYLKLIYNGEVIWDQITSIEEIIDPKEYVYDFTVPHNETFMVNEGIIIHNTLNSVSWDQNISYIKNAECNDTFYNDKECNIVKIGELIDNLLKENSSNEKLIDKIVLHGIKKYHILIIQIVM